MTRQNLQSHLSWLLQNSTLTKPTPPILPKIGDSSAPRTSQTLSSSAASSLGSLSSQKPDVPDGLGEPKPATRDVTERQAGGSESLKGIQRDDDDMGRLTSASKARKPSLVSRPDRPSSPLIKTQRSTQRSLKQEEIETSKSELYPDHSLP